jgi:hypothetical protein
LGDGFEVRLEVFDMLGRRVRTLFRGTASPGVYEEQFEASGLPTGVYFYRLTAQPPDGMGVLRRTGRMVLLK